MRAAIRWRGRGGGLNHATVSRHTRRLQLQPLTGDIKEPAASDGSTMERKTPRQRNERLSSALILESGPDKDASVGKEPVTGDDRVSVRCRSSAPPFLSNNRDRPAKVVVYRLHDPRKGSGNNNHPPPGYLRTLIPHLGSRQSHGSRIDRNPKSPIYGFYTLRSPTLGMNQGPLKAHYSAIIGQYLYSLNWTTCLHPSARSQSG